MKKVMTFSIACFGTLIANAQGNGEMGRDVFRGVTVIFVILSIMVFILAFMKSIFDFRLKNKIVDKGIPENVASSILQTEPGESRNSNIKWFALLTGLGTGLIIVNYTLPLGLHSVAIMAFSIALSFLGYFLFLKNTGK